jgi:rare lipoprotein A (peptidoglycan hydrolase)
MKMSDQSRAMTAATLPAAETANPDRRYSHRIRATGLTAIAVLMLAGCGSTGEATHLRSSSHTTPTAASVPAPATTSSTTTTTHTVKIPSARPQAVEPTAGQAGPAHHGNAAPPARDTSTTSSALPKVTGPASNTSAPAKGAPSTAQVRRALVSLRATEHRYRLDHLDTGGAVVDAATLPPGRWYTSIASFYGAPLFGNGVACGGILHPWTLGVANKTLPCGTEVLFEYGSRAIRVKVIDRGPYVAGREWDLTAATAVALHFPGLGPIRWRIVR